MGRGQVQGLPRVALADVSAHSASPRGIHATNRAPVRHDPARRPTPTQAPGQRGAQALCPGLRGHTLPRQPLARSRSRNHGGVRCEGSSCASLFPELPRLGMPERGQCWCSRGNSSPVPATTSWNDAQPTALLPPAAFRQPWDPRRQERKRKNICHSAAVILNCRISNV